MSFPGPVTRLSAQICATVPYVSTVSSCVFSCALCLFSCLRLSCVSLCIYQAVPRVRVGPAETTRCNRGTGLQRVPTQACLRSTICSTVMTSEKQRTATDRETTGGCYLYSIQVRSGQHACQVGGCSSSTIRGCTGSRRYPIAIRSPVLCADNLRKQSRMRMSKWEWNRKSRSR